MVSNDKMKKKILFISLLSLLLFSFSIVLAQKIHYPTVPPGITPPPPTAKGGLPLYVKYLFNFSIMIAGIIAFAALVYGGFKYLTSVGNPANREEAKNRITAAFIGLTILLLSYLILVTINPDLTRFKGKILKPNNGIYLIATNGKQYFIADSQNGILKRDDDGTPVKFIAVKFISPKPEYIIYSNPNKHELYSIYVSKGAKFDPENSKEIINTGKDTQQSLPFSHPPSLISIHFLWHRPGIYLFGDKGPPLFTQTTIDDLVNYDFNNKAKKIRTVSVMHKYFYDAILFQHPFENRDTTGKSRYYFNESDKPIEEPFKKDGVSSVAVFRKPLDKKTSGVITFYKKPNCPIDLGEGEMKVAIETSGGHAPKVDKAAKIKECEDATGHKCEIAACDLHLNNATDGYVLLEDTGLAEWGSIEIGADCSLMISTEEGPGLENGYSVLYSGRLCVSNLKTSTVYKKGQYQPVRAIWLSSIVK